MGNWKEAERVRDAMLKAMIDTLVTAVLQTRVIGMHYVTNLEIGTIG